MAETSFPVAGGAGVTDAAYEQLMGPITGSGRYAFGPTAGALSTPLIFADNTGRQIKAYANQAAIVRGFRWESGSTPPVVSLDANVSGNPRLDLIVLRLDRSNFTVRLGKTNGTPAAVPAAPAPIQDSGSTGRYELPIGTVRVVSSGTTGQPFIQSTDVAAKDWWIAPPGIVTKSTQNPTVSHGQLVHHYDTGRSYRAVGSTLVPHGEVGARTKLACYTGWISDNVIVTRINGTVHFQAYATWNGTPRAPSADTYLCVIPAAFRPSGDIAFPAWMTPNQVGIAYEDITSGILRLATFGTTFPTGGIFVASASWPCSS
jgi:hypothetical protein